jgi:hypothetical protein
MEEELQFRLKSIRRELMDASAAWAVRRGSSP